MAILSRSFYNRDTVLVAQELLGKQIIRSVNGAQLSGIIVETEAYYVHDSACHAYRGKTKSNEALFGPVGHAYIYFIYGNHYCLNFVAHTKEVGAGGVLIRALEPVDGIEYMQKFRKNTTLKNLTNGPGKLAQALDITKNLYGADITKKGSLYVTDGVEVARKNMCAAPRIGISKAQEKEWRFFMCDNPFVSR